MPTEIKHKLKNYAAYINQNSSATSNKQPCRAEKESPKQYSDNTKIHKFQLKYGKSTDCKNRKFTKMITVV